MWPNTFQWAQIREFRLAGFYWHVWCTLCYSMCSDVACWLFQLEWHRGQPIWSWLSELPVPHSILAHFASPVSRLFLGACSENMVWPVVPLSMSMSCSVDIGLWSRLQHASNACFVFFRQLIKSYSQLFAGSLSSKCLLWIRPFYVEMLNVAVSSLNCRAFIFNHDRVSDIIVETVKKSIGNSIQQNQIFWFCLFLIFTEFCKSFWKRDGPKSMARYIRSTYKAAHK